MGRSEEWLDAQISLREGDAVFVPAGTWHNVINTGQYPLKVSSVYAPPHHPRGTVQPTGY
jgi:mannose-6-phosphate isomerase-like protein (cupin superfamily)